MLLDSLQHSHRIPLRLSLHRATLHVLCSIASCCMAPYCTRILVQVKQKMKGKRTRCFMSIAVSSRSVFSPTPAVKRCSSPMTPCLDNITYSNSKQESCLITQIQWLGWRNASIAIQWLSKCEEKRDRVYSNNISHLPPSLLRRRVKRS